MTPPARKTIALLFRFVDTIARTIHRDLFLFILVPFASVRIYSAALASFSSIALLHGFLSDIIVSACLASIAGSFRAGRIRYLQYLFFLLLGCFIYWNHEHVIANGSNMSVLNLREALDLVFIKGSAINPRSAWLLFALLASLLFFAYATLNILKETPISRYEAGLLLVLLIVLQLPGRSRLTDGWRAYNFIEENLYWLISGSVEKGGDTRSRLPPQLINRNQLDGKPILPFPESHPNVLLIMLEGISGHMIAPTDENLLEDPLLPRLTSLNNIAKETIHYSQFVNTQRQTNRGQYAIICGDFPKLTSTPPKMNEYLREEGEPCLPKVLSDKGYTTIYMQSAPISYMNKSKFMPRAGFGTSLDDKDYAPSRYRGMWGVDDESLFEEAKAVISKQESPWLVTLLTVGTHHPYTVPNAPPGARISFKNAAECMDEQIGKFWEYLKESGFLENTLVVITSDESVGQASNRQQLLSQAWGFSLVSAPMEFQPHIVTRLYCQADIAISVLDYLGIEERSMFRGRSLFREYDSRHAVVLGNTYLHQFAFVEEGKRVIACSENMAVCGQQLIKEGRSLFSLLNKEPALHEITGRDKSMMTQILGWNSTIHGLSERQVIDLGTEVPLQSATSDWRLLLGGQALSAPVGSHVEVQLTISAEGDSAGLAALNAALKTSTSPQVFQAREIKNLRVGNQTLLRMDYDFKTAAEVVEFVLYGRQLSGNVTIRTKGTMIISAN